MATTKTAISVPSDLFKQMDQLSKKLRIPRSRLFARAVQEFIERRHAEDLTERLNRVYSKPESREDRELRRAAARAFRRLLEESQ